MPVLEARVGPSQTIPKALLPVWKRHEETNRERVDILVGLLEQEVPDETWLEGARRVAHQLAGSLGTFGLDSASLLALEAETLITAYPQVTAEQRQRLFRVVRFTCAVSQRPRLVLPDALLCNEVTQGFDGLGINNYSQVWLRGDLTEEEVRWVYEWGLAGYLPEFLSVDVLVRKLERALRAP